MFVVVIGVEVPDIPFINGGIIPLQRQEDASFLYEDMTMTTTNQVFKAICTWLATLSTIDDLSET